MKKLFACLLLVVGCSVSFAQTEKGQSLTSGNVGVSIGNEAFRFGLSRPNILRDRTFRYDLNASVDRGRFVRDNWLLLYSLGVGYGRTQYTTVRNEQETFIDRTNQRLSLSAGLGLRRYWPVVDRLYVWAGGGLSVTGRRNSLRTDQVPAGLPNEATVEQYETNWSVNPTGQLGAMYWLSDRVAAQLSIVSSVMPIGGSAQFGIVLLSGGQQVRSDTVATVAAQQTQRGRWLPGLSVAVVGNANETQTRAGTTATANTSSAYVNASAGRFMRDNLLLGAGVNYTAYRSGDRMLPGAPNYSLGFDVFARAYARTGRLRPFGQIGLSYGFDKAPTFARSTKTAGVNASAGLAYLLGDRFIVQSTIGSLAASYRWANELPLDGQYSNWTAGASATTFTSFAVYYAL